eukprot:7884677-Alexandrium_andersonii.AAC.1
MRDRVRPGAALLPAGSRYPGRAPFRREPADGAGPPARESSWPPDCIGWHAPLGPAPSGVVAGVPR